MFSLLLSVCLLEHFNLDTSAEEFITVNIWETTYNVVSTIFWSELKRWVKQWRIEMENRRAEYSAKATKAKEARVNGRKLYNIVEEPDSFLEALKYAEPDFYPNIRRLLIIVRSSHSKVFLGKGVPKICNKFTGEHPCRSVISVNHTSAWVFFCKFAANFRNIFS